jgi:hypothetical protein
MMNDELGIRNYESGTWNLNTEDSEVENYGIPMTAWSSENIAKI